MQQYRLANYEKKAEFLTRMIRRWAVYDTAKYVITPSERDQ
jgi:hypothetical protein